MRKNQWVIVLVVASIGWFATSGVLQQPAYVQLQDPLQQYYQPMPVKPLLLEANSTQEKVVQDRHPMKNSKTVIQKEVLDKKPKNLGQAQVDTLLNSKAIGIVEKEKLPENMTPKGVPTFGSQQLVLEPVLNNDLELKHVDLESHALDDLNFEEASDSTIVEGDKLQLLLLSEMVSWPTTIDHMAAEMLALSHSQAFTSKDNSIDPMRELDFLALSMLAHGEPIVSQELSASEQLAMLTLSDMLADEAVYSPDVESGEMVLAKLSLADHEESTDTLSDLPSELALLAINDKQYKTRAKYQHYKKHKHDAYEQPKYATQTQPSRYVKRAKRSNHALNDYRTIDTWSASEPHRTYTSKRHRSVRHYAVPEKGMDKPRYEMARASTVAPMLPQSIIQEDVVMQVADAIELPVEPDAQGNEMNANLDLFSAPILTEDEPMLVAEAEMPRDPSALFSDARLEKSDQEKKAWGKVSGNLFYSTRLKSGSPIIGSRMSFKPYDKWVFRAGAKTILFGAKKDFNYSWGIGYEDWRPGKFSFALNNWGPIRLGQDPLAGAKFSIDYNAVNKPTLFGFPLSISPAIDFPLSVNKLKGGWAPTVGLGHSWRFKDHWFIRFGVSRKLSRQAPWRWTYGFGRDSWKPFTFNVMYSNWGPNNDFRPNFRRNGRLSVEWKWLMEFK